MQAIHIAGYGGTEVLELVDAPDPKPKAGEVVIRSRAASVNPRDWMIRSGRYPFRWMLPKLPFVLGSDVSGVVGAVGEGVDGFVPGEPVAAMVPSSDGFGAYAEQVAVRATSVVPKPATVSFEAAAAVPLAGLTALQAIRDEGRLRPGQRVVVAGASGGVGHFGVQIARLLGAAEVVGVCSAANVDFVRDLGCSQVIDYRQERYEDKLRGVDLIFDAVGRTGFARARRALTPRGTYVSTVPGGALIAQIARTRLWPWGQRAAFVGVRSRGADLATLMRWMEEGRLRATIDQTRPLDRVRELHEHSRSFRTRGKNLISFPDSP
ncbi:MAG: NAD(P)-dependent alcohol dehydrogenase [Acidobacteriota bacterium]